MCMLCYCCLIRPKKIALLKCSDFDLKKQTVRVRAEKAKMLKESVAIIDMTSKKTAFPKLNLVTLDEFMETRLVKGF